MLISSLSQSKELWHLLIKHAKQRWNNIIIYNLNSHESVPAANSTTAKQLKFLRIFVCLQQQLGKNILQRSHDQKMYFFFN